MNTINRTRTTEANRLTIGAAIVCGLGFASAMSSTVERTVTVTLLLLVAAGVLVFVVRRVARVIRWRREDRADALAAAAWRAARVTRSVRAVA